MSNRGGRYRRGALAHAGPERPADNADYRRGDGLRRHRSQAGRLALDHGGLGDRRLLAQG